MKFTAYPKTDFYPNGAIAEAPGMIQLYRPNGGKFHKRAFPGSIRTYPIAQMGMRLGEVKARDDGEAIEKADQWLLDLDNLEIKRMIADYDNIVAHQAQP
jgi:hypothetical protein